MIPAEMQILRTQMKASLRDFSEKPGAAEALRVHLFAAPPWREACVVYGFVPLPSEPDWIGSLAPAGKTLAFPSVAGERLCFFAGGGLDRGLSGVREPVGGAPAPPPDLILVPGLAFDRRGGRLGRGGGMYDRFLAGVTAAGVPTIGVGFACQLVPEVPRERHDVPLDAVVTEAGFFPCRQS